MHSMTERRPGAPGAAVRATDVPWTPGSWRSRPAAQQPDWGSPLATESVLGDLAELPPLVLPGEVDELRAGLATVASGRAIMLQAGDCAERFGAGVEAQVRSKFRVILQMAVLLSYGSGLPVVKVGRIAGQYAKPRSRPTEIVDGTELPVYRGDIVNDPEPSLLARRADPARMRRAYDHACATLNVLHGLIRQGFAATDQVHNWNQDFVRDSPAGRCYEAVADEITRALRFGAACRADETLLDPDGDPSRTTRPGPADRGHLFTSHEALLPAYEQALTRVDPRTGRWVDTSAHMLWIGDRTRDPDGAHVEFLSGVANPVGLKLGPGIGPDELLTLCERLDPDRVPGRLTLISRMGADAVTERLMPLVEAVVADGREPVWLCDPMHGNTLAAPSGYKTRRLADVTAEIEGFFAVHRLFGTHPGGLHLELTGEDVTECLGGADEIVDTDLGSRYETACDPRLNASQSIELAFRVAELLQEHHRTSHHTSHHTSHCTEETV